MLCHWLLALLFSSLLSFTSADPIQKINQRYISYGKVDRTEIAAVLTEISTIHAANSLLIVVNEYEGTKVLRQSICHLLEEVNPRSYDMRKVETDPPSSSSSFSSLLFLYCFSSYRCCWKLLSHDYSCTASTCPPLQSSKVT